MVRAGAPTPRGAERRGRPPTYGQQGISLAKRAGQRRGWQSEELVLYREAVTKTFKTFLATYRPAGGLIRVVLVREDDGWVAYFCTDPAATVAEVLGAVADRAAVEQDYHDVKEVHGAGQQQLRHYWANVAAFHLNLWRTRWWSCGPGGVLRVGCATGRTARGTTRSVGLRTPTVATP